MMSSTSINGASGNVRVKVTCLCVFEDAMSEVVRDVQKYVLSKLVGWKSIFYIINYKTQLFEFFSVLKKKTV